MVYMSCFISAYVNLLSRGEDFLFEVKKRSQLQLFKIFFNSDLSQKVVSTGESKKVSQ